LTIEIRFYAIRGRDLLVIHLTVAIIDKYKKSDKMYLEVKKS
jgi:hypothetical protein